MVPDDLHQPSGSNGEGRLISVDPFIRGHGPSPISSLNSASGSSPAAEKRPNSLRVCGEEFVQGGLKEVS